MTKEQIQPYVDKKLVNAQRHPTLPLTIYNYSKSCQYSKVWDDITTRCRGLVIDDHGTIVANPFPKFFNLGEVEKLPDGDYSVWEKLDGSLGIVFFYDGEWHITTRGSFTSDQAIAGYEMLKGTSMLGVARDQTHMFEIIYPGNRIVIDYGYERKLVYLGSRVNATGEDLGINFDMPFQTALQAPANTPVEQLTKHQDNVEGFVLRWSDGYRLKVKLEEYVRLHRLVTGVNAKTIWEMLRDGTPLDELLDRVPDEFNSWVKKTVADLNYKYSCIKDDAELMYSSAKEITDRKSQAEYILDNSSPGISGTVFRMLDGKDYSDTIWKQIKPVAEKPFTQEI